MGSEICVFEYFYVTRNPYTNLLINELNYTPVNNGPLRNGNKCAFLYSFYNN